MKSDEMYVKSIEEMLNCFKKGWGVEFRRGTDIKGVEKAPKIISSEFGLSDYIRNCPVDPVEELNKPHLVHNWREFHLYFDDFGYDEGNGEYFYTYAETYWAIFKEKDHIVRTDQVSLCTSDLWNHGFRIFIHPQKGFGDAFEIFVGCETHDGYKIAETSPIRNFLEAGMFGQLFEGHDLGF
jgi:hypothetical protein